MLTKACAYGSGPVPRLPSMARRVKNPPAVQETQETRGTQLLGREDPPGVGKWQPAQVFLPSTLWTERSLKGCGPQGLWRSWPRLSTQPCTQLCDGTFTASSEQKWGWQSHYLYRDRETESQRGLNTFKATHRATGVVSIKKKKVG